MSTSISSKGFSEYLSQKREQLALSQEALAAELAARSSVFGGVDAATISRWERAKVQPNLRRQVELVLFFGDDPYELKDKLNLTIEDPERLKPFLNILDNELSYNHYIGAHPYLLKRTRHFDKVVTPPKTNRAWPQLLANYHENITRGIEQWSVQWIMELQNNPAAHVVYYLVDNELAGHLVMLRLKQDCVDDLLTNRIDDMQISDEMFASMDESHSFYILANFGGSRDIVIDILAEQLAVASRNSAFNFLCAKIRNNFGSKIMNLFDHEMVHKGNKTEEKDFGVKVGSARYEYTSHRISREAIYASRLYFYLIDQQ